MEIEILLGLWVLGLVHTLIGLIWDYNLYNTLLCELFIWGSMIFYVVSPNIDKRVVAIAIAIVVWLPGTQVNKTMDDLILATLIYIVNLYYISPSIWTDICICAIPLFSAPILLPCHVILFRYWFLLREREVATEALEMLD